MALLKKGYGDAGWSDQLVELTWGGNKLHFTYDSTGPLSVSYNGTEYF